MTKNIREAARVIRSKNAGPFELTLDIIFRERRYYDLFKRNNLVDTDLLRRLYRVGPEDIVGIVWFEPANAVKMTIRRPLASGSPGDTDIYGAQQHAPLLGIFFED